MRMLGATDNAPVVVHPTAGWQLKTWPIERWSSLVSRLGQRLRATVLVAGAARDRAVLERESPSERARARESCATCRSASLPRFIAPPGLSSGWTVVHCISLPLSARPSSACSARLRQRGWRPSLLG